MEKTEKMVKTDWISEAVNLSVHMLDQEIRHTFLKVFRDQVEYFTFSSEATKAKDLLKVRLINVWRAKRAMGGRRRPRSSCRRQRIAIVVIMIWYVSPNGEKIGLVPPPLHTGLPYTWFTPPGLLSLKKTHNVSGDARRRKGSSLWSISSANLSYCMHLTTPKIGKFASIFLKRELKLFAILQFYIFFGLSLLTLFLFEIWIDMILFFFCVRNNALIWLRIQLLARRPQRTARPPSQIFGLFLTKMWLVRKM